MKANANFPSNVQAWLKALAALARGSGVRNASGLAAVALMSSPAYAQFQKGTQLLNDLQGWLLSIGAVVVTIALMFVGFRMAFQAAQGKDVAPVFWGGVLIGGGSAIAGMFF